MAGDPWLGVPRRGFLPVPLTLQDTVVRWKDCPDCRGRGWFLINPFATGGADGAGGIDNLCQCLTCRRTHDFYQRHGRLPEPGEVPPPPDPSDGSEASDGSETSPPPTNSEGAAR